LRNDALSKFDGMTEFSELTELGSKTKLPNFPNYEIGSRGVWEGGKEK
jgi:hypothetical protein